MKTTPARDRGPLASNRYACCGWYVGDTFTGYTYDRMNARGPLFCDRCPAHLERGRERKAER